jgi:hypothetical protein
MEQFFQGHLTHAVKLQLVKHPMPELDELS